jgi:hypothetical protein
MYLQYQFSALLLLHFAITTLNARCCLTAMGIDICPSAIA